MSYLILKFDELNDGRSCLFKVLEVIRGRIWMYPVCCPGEEGEQFIYTAEQKQWTSPEVTCEKCLESWEYIEREIKLQNLFDTITHSNYTRNTEEGLTKA